MTSLIIFDCDGVLVDSEPIANQILAEHLTRAGLPMTREESIRTFTGLAMGSVLEKVEAMLGAPLPEGFLDGVQRDTFAALRESVDPIEGAIELVKAVKASGFKCCVASSGGFDKMDVTLTKTGLRSHFDGHIFSASQVARGKPAPDLFLYAAAQMGEAPERCLVIEDSKPGVDAALAAGMTVLALVRYGNEGDIARPGVRVIRTLKEAMVFLRSERLLQTENPGKPAPYVSS